MADYLSPLVQHQKIFMVDAHGHENNPHEREKMYDDKTYDLHLHKKSNPISVNGKKECSVDIRIPINNPDRDVDIEINGDDFGEIPGRIRKEVARELNHHQTRERLVKELSDIMATYPSSVKEDKEKTGDALRRFADAFGVQNIPVEDEWLTHITEEPKGVSMLSVLSDKQERYNFLVCDDYMLAERAEPTKKYIIAVSGAAHRGKSETIKMVCKDLMATYPEHAIILDKGEGKNEDVKAILFIHGAKVGIESRGDTWSRQMRTVEEFVRMGCDIILVACRTSGMTSDAIKAHKDTYIIDRIPKENQKDKALQYYANRELAKQIMLRVEAYAVAAFEEL